jgi:plastocyanin
MDAVISSEVIAHRDLCRRMAARFAVCVVCASAALDAIASSVHTLVTDREGQPVAEVVVYALPVGSDLDGSALAVQPAMGQRDEQFTPHLLVVQTGTSIVFPNDDIVSHHVYSFSEAKRFELPLYKGTAHPPVTFDTPGVIDLGCNIHDHMEAHILVVDTPYFAMTGVDGRAELDELPAGEYTIHVFTPRLKTSALPEPHGVNLGDTQPTELSVQFEDRLRPPHAATSESLNWSRY